jgi:hypothetical protein
MVMPAKIDTDKNCAKTPMTDKVMVVNVERIEAAIEKRIRMKERYTSQIEGSWIFLNLGTII